MIITPYLKTILMKIFRGVLYAMYHIVKKKSLIFVSMPMARLSLGTNASP